jgi:hypothetical protein
MKEFNFKPAIFLISLVLILNSCRESVVNEVTINDFNALSSEFKEPSKEYTTAPFFVWNYKITREEIDNYLNDFKKAGSSQVFIHPRPGLITEYLSDEWFDLFKYTVEKGKELGMNIWIYDENSYPSGFGGGHVPDEMPESVNQGQGLKMVKFETLPDTADRYYLCLKEDNGKYINITSSLTGEKGKSGKYLLFAKTYNGKSDWYGGFSYVDLLYPGVTQKFIEVTMTGYENSIGTEFGKTVQGTFTDEPEIDAPGGGIRWTPDLFDVFHKNWHYDLITQLPSLYEETGDWKKVRHDYTQTLLQLFIDRWSKPWYSYCEENGLKFTGHYWEHSWPNIRPGGDNMAMYAWHQIPAIDMLFNQWNDSSVNAQFGNVRSVKELASVANQTGRKRKLCETYGGSGWELTFKDMKRLGDWEYALGINLMNQHLAHITLAGARKYDYPLTFTYHEPWWNDYKYINDHFARLSMALSSGKQINNILIIEPTTSVWLYDSYVNPDPVYAETGQKFQDFITMLEQSQVEYDLGSENIINDRGSVSNGEFIVGQCSYSTVVLPPMMENIDLKTYKLLKKFVAGGGKLVTFSLPSLVNGEPLQGLQDFFINNSDKIAFETDLNDSIIAKYFTNPDISFSATGGGDLYHHRRILSDGEVLFLVNSSLEKPLSAYVKVKGADAIEMNTLTGEINGYPNAVDGENITFSCDLPPAGSLLLYIPSVKKEIPLPPLQPPARTALLPASSMKVTRDGDNVLTLEFCDLLLGNELATNVHNYDAADRVYKYFGFKNGNPWNTSVQFRTQINDRDTFNINTGFTATYHFNILGIFDFSAMKAVVERPYLWKVSVNGTEVKAEEGKWWLDREFGVFNIGSQVKKGDNSVALNVYPMRVNAEIEPIYILGDFSVKPAEKGWTIEAPVKLLTEGSWKKEGMPFYSSSLTYSQDFNIEKPQGRYTVKLSRWNGTVAEVHLNGEAAAPVAFPPYTTDVTNLVRPGINKVEVKVVGSLKNLLGPHFNNPAPGLVSPWLWRNVKSYPPGKEYQLLDYGLFEDFSLIEEK